MNRRKELNAQYQEIKIEAGVYRIINRKTGRMLVDSTPNLKSLNGKRFTLNMGTHINKQLQQEWKTYGEDAFDIEVLEVLKPKEDPFFDAKDALEKLEQHWLDKLQPYGDKGYQG
ncbi:GIY-YIG nuclease family protein [Paenibacillus sp. JX-17]|uniref:GIY-YIG nuclease family protein n=1 Tax=Paenibacillus lacisoli TaxID=3064525 RepID=A0ABT9CIL8_9BACL|nr:GIY-YIG nuclease family protein [Paenibacillus sp. JX-17]MDO7907453.1 GIY-YIG nuclease family protein [Paenibacillus sp. JX-17]